MPHRIPVVPRSGRAASRHAVFAVCLVFSLLSLPAACAFGPLDIPLMDVLRVVWAMLTGTHSGVSSVATMPDGLRQALDAAALRAVIGDLRLPRVLLSFAVGSGLAVAGTVFQGILRNPLADPFTLGVSGGAAFGAALAISLGLTGLFQGLGLPLFAFAGAGCALTAVLLLGRVGGGLRRDTLILAGVVVSAFLAALIALLKALDESSVTGIVFWIMGSFQNRSWAETRLLSPGLLAGCAVAFSFARSLDILSLGDGTARVLGLSVRRTRLVLLLAASCITASCVAVSGIIGFIGLIIPHLCRLLLGVRHRDILPLSALAGGLLLLWADVAARTLLPGGVELPVGVITALLGGPFFCLLLRKKGGGIREDTPITDRDGTGLASGSSIGSAGAFRPVDGPYPDTTAHVELEHLHFSYGSAPVLRDISFALPRGGLIGLLGPNGSGKSTLLDCMAGLLEPSEGVVLMEGISPVSLTERQRATRVALLPQRPETVPAFSAFDLALMGRYARTGFFGGYDAHDKTVALAALEETGAAHLAPRSAATLSGGELQRVLLARTLAQETPLLLLDEPTSGLDPACAAAILDILARRSRERGITVFAALHDLNLAALYCQRLLVLKNGRIAADGPTKAVFTREVLEAAYEARFVLAPHPSCGLPQVMAVPGRFSPGNAAMGKEIAEGHPMILSSHNTVRLSAGQPRSSRPLFRNLLFPLCILFTLFCIRPVLCQGSVSITDDTGEQVALSTPALRIIPLYASLGEILAALGCDGRIVGRTAADTGTPGAVVGTHMRPDLERIIALRPDLVLQMEGREEAAVLAESLKRHGIAVARFRVADFASLLSCIQRIGILTDRAEAAERLIREQKSRLAAVAAKTALLSPKPVIFFEVRYPNLLGAGAGSMVSAVITAAGGRNALAGYPEKMVRLNEEMLPVLNPDIYLAQYGPMNKNPLPPATRPRFQTLRAVAAGHSLLVAEERFSRPGPQSIEVVEWLAGQLLLWHNQTSFQGTTTP